MLTFKKVFAKNINQKTYVLKNISFYLYKGQDLVILGSSGAGKTSLFKCLINQMEIDSGTIEFNEQKLNNLSKKNWKKISYNFGYIVQKPFLFEEDTVFNAIKRDFLSTKNIFQQISFFLSKKDCERIFNILNELEILDKAFSKIKDLSGGEKQRVEIAKTLLKKPQVILADEPTTGLDIDKSFKVIILLQKLAKKYNCSLLLVLHDINLVKKIKANFIALKKGGIILKGNTEQLDNKTLNYIYHNNDQV